MKGNYFLLSPSFQDPYLPRTHLTCLHYSMKSKRYLHYYWLLLDLYSNNSPSIHVHLGLFFKTQEAFPG